MGRINEYNAYYLFYNFRLYLIYPFSFISIQNIEKKIKLLNFNLKLFITRTGLALKNNRFMIN